MNARLTRPAVPSLTQLRLWHLCAIVAFAAVAIVDIQSLRTPSALLVGLAAAGYVGFGALVWLSSMALPRLGRAIGPRAAVVAFLLFAAILYLVAVILYVLIEQACQGLLR